MRLLPLLLTLAMTLGLSACGEAEPSVSTSQPSQGVVSNQQEADGSNILIAYFSVPENVSTDGVDAVSGASIVVDNDEVLGSTEYVAQVIQQTIGGDLFRIEAAEPYPLDHEPLVDQAAEERDNQVRPELTSHVDSLLPMWIISSSMKSFYWVTPFGGGICQCLSIHFWKNMILEQRPSFLLSHMEAVVRPAP